MPKLLNQLKQLLMTLLSPPLIGQWEKALETGIQDLMLIDLKKLQLTVLLNTPNSKRKKKRFKSSWTTSIFEVAIPNSSASSTRRLRQISTQGTSCASVQTSGGTESRRAKVESLQEMMEN